MLILSLSYIWTSHNINRIGGRLLFFQPDEWMKSFSYTHSSFSLRSSAHRSTTTDWCLLSLRKPQLLEFVSYTVIGYAQDLVARLLGWKRLQHRALKSYLIVLKTSLPLHVKSTVLPVSLFFFYKWALAEEGSTQQPQRQSARKQHHHQQQNQIRIKNQIKNKNNRVIQFFNNYAKIGKQDKSLLFHMFLQIVPRRRSTVIKAALPYSDHTVRTSNWI